MSDEKIDNPTPGMLDIMWAHYERTLRDEFAKAALQAIIQRASAKDNPTDMIRFAYTCADVSLLIRQQKKT